MLGHLQLSAHLPTLYFVCSLHDMAQVLRIHDACHLVHVKFSKSCTSLFLEPTGMPVTGSPSIHIDYHKSFIDGSP